MQITKPIWKCDLCGTLCEPQNHLGFNKGGTGRDFYLYNTGQTTLTDLCTECQAAIETTLLNRFEDV